MTQYKDARGYELNKTALYCQISALIKVRDPFSSIIATKEEVQDVLRAMRYCKAELNCISVDEALFGSRDPNELRHERAMEIANKKCEAKNLIAHRLTLFDILIIHEDGTPFEIVQEGDYMFLKE